MTLTVDIGDAAVRLGEAEGSDRQTVETTIADIRAGRRQLSPTNLEAIRPWRDGDRR
jgi:hypothetical protein